MKLASLTLVAALAVLAKFPRAAKEFCTCAGRVVIFDVARKILKMTLSEFRLGVK